MLEIEYHAFQLELLFSVNIQFHNQKRPRNISVLEEVEVIFQKCSNLCLAPDVKYSIVFHAQTIKLIEIQRCHLNILKRFTFHVRCIIIFSFSNSFRDTTQQQWVLVGLSTT